MTPKALFLDRDGVVNEERHYVFRIEDFVFVDGIFDLCRAAIGKGFDIVIVTNQAGIARGYYDEKDFETLTDWMCRRFAENGVVIRKVYYSPFHPTEGKGKYRREAFCRKPNPGMIIAARDEFGFDLSKSVLVGDKTSDIEAGKRAGVGRNLLIDADTRDDFPGAVRRLSDVIPFLEDNAHCGEHPRSVSSEAS